MDLRITFFKQHATQESSSAQCEQSDSLPWERIQNIQVVGSISEESVQRQVKRYLFDCAKSLKQELRQRFQACPISPEFEKRFQRLRHAKKSIEKAMVRLRQTKLENAQQDLVSQIRKRQEQLFVERWSLIVEREESYRLFNSLVYPHLEKLFAGSLDPVIVSGGIIVQRKDLKKGKKGIVSPSLARITSKMRSLQAQVDIYHPRHLPKASSSLWKEELNELLDSSLNSIQCECPGCRQDMEGVCMQTGQLFCSDHFPEKNCESLEWSKDLANSLRKMKASA